MPVPAVASDPVPLLRQLLACPSITPATSGVLDVLEAALCPLGFSVHRLTFSGNGSYPVENLLAVRERGGRRLLFAGHTDVVDPGERAAWRFDPFGVVEEDGLLYGRGATDMKSAIAAFAAAAASAIGSGAAERGTLALAITNDEEADAVNGTAKLMDWAAAQGHNWDFAIVGEPSSAERLGDGIKIGRRGSLNGRITVRGVQGHVAYPEKASNPLPLLSGIAASLSEARLDGGTDHFPPSNLELTSIDVGNGTSNVIPAAGTLRFNIRYNDLWTPETLSTWIGERLGSIEPGTCAVAFEVLGQPSRAFLSAQGEAVDLLVEVIRAQTGETPARSTGGGTSDARFIARHCPVVECGLVGASMHKVDEHVALADVRGLSRIYAEFVERYFAPGP